MSTQTGNTNAATLGLVTPSLNHVEGLVRTLASVAAEAAQRKPLRHIVVEQGSRDGSIGALTAWVQKHPHVTRLNEREPCIAFAASSGLAEAARHCDLLGILMPGDTLMPGTLATIERMFARDPRTLAVIGDTVRTDRDGRELAKLPRVTLTTASIATMRPHHLPALFFRREALYRVGPFDYSLQHAAVFEFLLRFASRVPPGAIAQVPLTLVATINDPTLTTSQPDAAARDNEVEAVLARNRGTLGLGASPTGPLARLRALESRARALASSAATLDLQPAELRRLATRIARTVRGK